MRRCDEAARHFVDAESRTMAEIVAEAQATARAATHHRNIEAAGGDRID
jgi:hypothetical protein